MTRLHKVYSNVEVYLEDISGVGPYHTYQLKKMGYTKIPVTTRRELHLDEFPIIGEND